MMSERDQHECVYLKEDALDLVNAVIQTDVWIACRLNEKYSKSLKLDQAQRYMDDDHQNEKEVMDSRETIPWDLGVGAFKDETWGRKPQLSVCPDLVLSARNRHGVSSTNRKSDWASQKDYVLVCF